MVGAHPTFKKVLQDARTVAASDATVLIQGETGTGKDLIARFIHAQGERRKRPLITVNCAALPAGLVESELFGHEKGAFTGAVQRKPGRFEIANARRSFSMKSASCLWKRRPSFCAYCSRANSSASAARKRSR
jgi:transcriptional regulator with GAF, ATPase, and Fis domain